MQIGFFDDSVRKTFRKKNIPYFFFGGGGGGMRKCISACYIFANIIKNIFLVRNGNEITKMFHELSADRFETLRQVHSQLVT